MSQIESYESYLESRGLQQIELFGGSAMTEELTEELYKRLTTKPEIKPFLLRGPKELMEEFSTFCKATNSNMTEVLLETMKLVLERSKQNPDIQKAIKKIQAEEKKAKKSAKSTRKSTTTKRKNTKKKENPEQVEEIAQ